MLDFTEQNVVTFIIDGYCILSKIINKDFDQL